MIANYLSISCIVECREHNKNTYNQIDTRLFLDYHIGEKTRQMVDAAIK